MNDLKSFQEEQDGEVLRLVGAQLEKIYQGMSMDLIQALHERDAALLKLIEEYIDRVSNYNELRENKGVAYAQGNQQALDDIKSIFILCQ